VEIGASLPHSVTPRGISPNIANERCLSSLCAVDVGLLAETHERPS
jgi:hypothetical protein